MQKEDQLNYSNMTIETILKVIGSDFEVQVDEACSPIGLKIKASDLVVICERLYNSEETYFDFLSCITGIDNGPEANKMEVVYNLYSIPNDFGLTIKVELPRDKPEIDSITSIWQGANWLERETFDLLGIVFTGHPDLRRILLPDNWEGYPLRKDYSTQEYFHGIKVDY